MFSSKAVSTVKILMSSVVDLAKKREVIELVVRLRALPNLSSHFGLVVRTSNRTNGTTMCPKKHSLRPI